MAALCRHLILQGYDATEITVLTTYTGQMFLLKKEINDLPSCKGVHVTVVDNYQGEENKIILLSLVRSNDENNIGFLKTDNRICVAISRAKYVHFGIIIHPYRIIFKNNFYYVLGMVFSSLGI